MQSLLRRNSLSSELVASVSDPSLGRDQEGLQRDDHSQDRSYRSGQPREKKEATKEKTSCLNTELERERSLNRSMSDQLQQTRSQSTSPARSTASQSIIDVTLSHSDILTHVYFLCPLRRLDSLVQSQARELSQLRQQIKESRRLGGLQRRQLEELNRAFKELLQASEVDYYMGEVVKEQLDKSLGILDRLEGRLDKGSRSFILYNLIHDEE